MSHNEIYKQFELYFPDYAKERVAVWFPNGKNCIRVRQINGQEFVFSYIDQNTWKFETVNNFLKSMKEKNDNE